VDGETFYIEQVWRSNQLEEHRALPSDTPHRLVSDQMRRAESRFMLWRQSILWVLSKRQNISFVWPESLVQIK
jgi:hypothetical protein